MFLTVEAYLPVNISMNGGIMLTNSTDITKMHLMTAKSSSSLQGRREEEGGGGGELNLLD